MADEPPPPIVIADPALLALPPLADGEVVRDCGDRAYRLQRYCNEARDWFLKGSL